jgi:ribonuclease HI
VLIDADQPGSGKPNAPPVAVVARPLGVQTNNFAEYSAVVLALEKAAALGALEVELVLDSKLVVEQLAGRWKVRHHGLAPLVERARALLAGFARWSIRHEPRAANHAADALANLALDDPAAARAAEAGSWTVGDDPTPAAGSTAPAGGRGLPWSEFAAVVPEMAEAGERMMRAFTVGYLATLRPEGGPRVHPVSVSLTGGGLYVFLIAGSRRAQDLVHDPRYALHVFPHAPSEDAWDDEEFELEGRVRPVSDPAALRSLRAAHTDSAGPDDAAYELLVERAHWKSRPGGRARLRHWPA